jgi:hypothetical protein
MGAQRLSGQHHTVRSLRVLELGRGTPHEMLPVMRKGRSVLPVRKRTPASSRMVAGAVAVFPVLELDGEGLLVALWPASRWAGSFGSTALKASSRNLSGYR